MGAGWAGSVTSPEMSRVSLGVEGQLCRTCPGVMIVAVLLPQTKDVTTAMNERKFDEAMKLRGR